MLEITVHGLRLGTPQDLAAAGALVTWGGEELARFQECYPGGVYGPLEAELRILIAALDWARDHGGMGETVKVLSGLGSLASACRTRSEPSSPELADLLGRLERISSDFEGIYAEISPGWITAPAQGLALRSLADHLQPIPCYRPGNDASPSAPRMAPEQQLPTPAIPESRPARAGAHEGSLR